MTFGAFVEFAPGKEGMIHISKLENHRVAKVEDVLKVGDTTWVKVVEIDEKGRINLSRKDALEEIQAKKIPTGIRNFQTGAAFYVPPVFLIVFDVRKECE